MTHLKLQSSACKTWFDSRVALAKSSSSAASQFTEVVEGHRQVRRAVAMTTGAIDDQVDALAIRCLGETTP